MNLLFWELSLAESEQSEHHQPESLIDLDNSINRELLALMSANPANQLLFLEEELDWVVQRGWNLILEQESKIDDLVV